MIASILMTTCILFYVPQEDLFPLLQEPKVENLLTPKTAEYEGEVDIIVYGYDSNIIFKDKGKIKYDKGANLSGYDIEIPDKVRGCPKAYRIRVELKGNELFTYNPKTVQNVHMILLQNWRK